MRCFGIIGQHIGKSWALIQYVQLLWAVGCVQKPKQVNAGGVPLKSPPPKQKYPASCHLEKEEARCFRRSAHPFVSVYIFLGGNKKTPEANS